MEETYRSDFETFMSHTDEKAILLEEIAGELGKIGARSLLDIGAGNGELALPLSKRVDRYVAIESKANFVSTLRGLGLEVLEGRFPMDVPAAFDCVLSSHSLSYAEENHKPFLSKAWECVAPGGELLIVTYRGEDDDWNRLLGHIDERQLDRNTHGYQSILSLLEPCGEVSVRKVQSSVTTKSLEDMLAALSFVFGNGIPEKKELFLSHRYKLGEYLEKHYYNGQEYSFPFQHFFVSVKKA